MAGGFCKDCFRGSLRGDATPTGTIETIHGLQTYVAHPEEGKQPLGLVVIIPDIFGWTLPNNRVLADAYARRGPFVVYLPDFMDGHAPSPSLLTKADRLLSPQGWLATLFLKPVWLLQLAPVFLPLAWRLRAAVAWPRIRAFFRALRDRNNNNNNNGNDYDDDDDGPASTPAKVGAAGFCWGGRYAVLLAGRAATAGAPAGPSPLPLPPLVDCAFTAHPSLLAVPADVEDVRQPLSVANGWDDAWLGRRRMEVVKRTLETRGDRHGRKKHEVVVYEGARHGFAIRGDPRDPRQAEMGLRAEDQAVRWFRRWFLDEE